MSPATPDLWAVVEYVAEVAAAATAMDFSARCKPAAVLGGADCAFNRLGEARPARTGVKFVHRSKNREIAAGT